MNMHVEFVKARISVVICAYSLERWEKLVSAVRSIERQTLPAHEIIVVIDHNQTLYEQARNSFTLNNKRAYVIENKEQKGLSGARNSGVAFASGELIAFLDDDACAEPDWLRGMADAMADPNVMGVGGNVEPDWEEDEPGWFPAEFRWVVGCSYVGMPSKEAPIRNPIGANMCIRREVFLAVGGFRNGIGRVGTLPVGCEETELCIRARQHWPERTFLYVPRVAVSHYVPQKRASWRYFLTRCYAEGISKAAISRFVGAKDSLSAESSYTLQTLPAGVVRNLGEIILQRRLTSFVRASAIVLGLGVTASGYMIGKCLPLQTGEESSVERQKHV
jgi:GT2 family glycosyltransferase